MRTGGDARGRAALRALLPGVEAEDELLNALLTGAEDSLLTLTKRQSLPEEMHSLLIRLALVRFNRLGMEGETSRREGSLSVSAEDIPKDLMREIRAYRLAEVPS